MEANHSGETESSLVDREQIVGGIIALNNILLLQMTTYLFSLTLFIIVFVYSTCNLIPYQEEFSSFIMSSRSREGLCTEEVQ